MGMHTPIAKASSKQFAAGNTAKNQDLSTIEKLLSLEAEVRKCVNRKQLQFLIANETPKITSARQVLVLSGTGRLTIKTITSLATLDKTSPTLNWLEKSLALLPDHEASHVNTAILDVKNSPGGNWPFAHVMKINLPLNNTGRLGQLALLSEQEFTPHDTRIMNRLADTYAHAWRALSSPTLLSGAIAGKRTVLLTMALATAAMFIPVTMSVLAPMEIIAHDASIAAAPLNGVIGNIRVEPNTSVKSGDLLFTYVSTDLANAYEVARQTVAIAQSRYRRASQDALGSGEGRREMAELKSELELATAKLNYARQRLELSRVRASQDGIVLFSDKDDWVGKPVITGEQIMKIATPLQTRYLIRLPVGDAIILKDGNDVRIFLDANPLNPISAKITRRSYHATTDEAGNFAYSMIARTTRDKASINPADQRIGLRGTAQIFGSKVPLAFFLFRKPFSAFRQYLGL